MSKSNDAPNNKADSTPSNVTINHYPQTLCHQHSGPNGSIFHAISFKYHDAWASFIVADENSIHQSVKRNGDIIPGRVDVILGAPDDVRSVSILADDGETYISQPMFNSTISSSIASDRKDYLRSIAV